MRVLFIGGTGIISSACSPLAIESGIDLYLLNRGQSHRGVPVGAKVLHGDIRDRASVESAIGDMKFDAVVNWIAFTTDHIQQDLDVFRGRTGQYVFISSASAYQTPPSSLPVTESTVLDNPYWQYSRNKIACEEMLVRAYRDEKFPTTIVRPSHTYDRTLLPFDHGWTVVDRMRRGKPVVVHGDGTSLWVLTHHRDFAAAFVPMLGNPHTIGDAFHITSDEWLSWNQIYDQVAEAAGTKAEMVHISSDTINAVDPGWGAGLLGDKANSMVFDNTKIKRIAPNWSANIPFRRGAEEILAWFEEDPSRQKVNAQQDALEDQLIEWAQRQ
ncbi:SDR family oxidoreductase [Fimbriimonas ginsengisoli]|uniref:Putative mRNA-binding protein n=1 Tax=Fimbriimonas ginsengisoli Gsoil 348 TaxID=661478 RepID=A0A068NUQ3_FIMGI|nr:SDR family oxidoreductase [Fimbriimonas ginsengisoli]AIE87171.1 putative mRNA-binding protein [Fimbriimonas ginsengisoli Gsoil 348]